MNMISVASLTKRYGPIVAVDEVTFTCQQSTVTGFLGPNGAGKTTTLRALTGLTRPDTGQATIAGHRFADLPNPARVAGTLLDASALHAGRTGRATLRIAATMTGMPSRRVDQMLAAVGLTGAAGRRVGTYSLGMRQRLGLAQALIAEPNVLILDEPATGLDPEGIAWIRGLLRDFADQGGTVLLSSHLLAEVQATADHLVVINAGRIVAAGALTDLLGAPGLIVRAGDQVALRRLLAQHAVPFTPAPVGALHIDTSTGVSAAQISALAVIAGLPLIELRPAQHAGLEDLFFALTNPAAGTGGGTPTPEEPR
ncbi:MAG: ABC transporter ATP-binding protein [Streptosporangiaceae bacterium]